MYCCAYRNKALPLPTKSAYNLGMRRYSYLTTLPTVFHPMEGTKACPCMNGVYCYNITACISAVLPPPICLSDGCEEQCGQSLSSHSVCRAYCAWRALWHFVATFPHHRPDYTKMNHRKNYIVSATQSSEKAAVSPKRCPQMSGNAQLLTMINSNSPATIQQGMRKG